MARVTYGSGVTELTGSIGGVTYQKNASGNIAKLRANPTVNPTALQADYQTNMSICVAFWPTLSQANKDLWDAFAAAHDHTTPWGEVKTLSGYQWFLSCNLNNLLTGQAIISPPPSWAIYSPPASFVIETSATYIRLFWDPALSPASYIALYVSLPLRQSSLKLRRSLFFLKYITTGYPITRYDFTTLYEAFANITWSTFFASSCSHIIVRVKIIKFTEGLASPYTSAIIKI